MLHKENIMKRQRKKTGNVNKKWVPKRITTEYIDEYRKTQKEHEQIRNPKTRPKP